jgi:hypothetical protein
MRLCWHRGKIGIGSLLAFIPNRKPQNPCRGGFPQENLGWAIHPSVAAIVWCTWQVKGCLPWKMFAGACICGIYRFRQDFSSMLISLDICEFAGILEALGTHPGACEPSTWMEALAFILLRSTSQSLLWIIVGS